MAERSSGMMAEERQPFNRSGSVRKAAPPGLEGEEDTDRMRAEVRELEENLAANVAALRLKLSLDRLKARAKDELTNRSKAALGSAGHTGGEALRRLLRISADQPFIPVAISTIIVAVAALRRALRR